MKSFRVDIVIATLALLISAGATLSSVYQTKVIVRQLSSSVWPYLSIGRTTSGNNFGMSITNDGLGPALVRSASLSLDGETLPSYRAGVARLNRGAGPKRRLTGSYASIGPTSVIRAGERLDTFTLSGLPASSVAFGDRFSIKLCYCSLLDQCWSVRDREQRVAVASCSEHTGIGY